MKSLLFLVVTLSSALAFAPPSFVTRRTPSVVFSSEGGDTAAEAPPTFDTYEPGVTKVVVYKDEEKGEGDRVAEPGDIITVDLEGRLYPSRQNFCKNEGYAFELDGGNTFPGFDYALKGTQKGQKRLIRVPPNLAYGASGAYKIPPNSDLEFEVEVKGIARGQVEGVIAKIGLDRIGVGAFVLFLFIIAPMLPS